MLSWEGIEMLDDGPIDQIAVEIDGLKQVAASLRALLEANFRVQVPKVYDAVQSGAALGGTIAGESWMSLQHSLHTSLQGTATALFNLDAGTLAITIAAELIAEDFGDSDAFARACVNDVQGIMIPPPRDGQL